jgi:hypothetical protein
VPSARCGQPAWRRSRRCCAAQPASCLPPLLSPPLFFPSSSCQLWCPSVFLLQGHRAPGPQAGQPAAGGPRRHHLHQAGRFWVCQEGAGGAAGRDEDGVRHPRLHCARGHPRHHAALGRAGPRLLRAPLQQGV